MLSIRLRRIGKAKRPSYRLIVLDKRKDPWGDYLEDLGSLNPLTNPATVKLNAERIKYWLSVGAQPSGTIHNLLVDQKILNEPKVRVGRPKKKAKEEAAKTEPAAPAAPPAAATPPAPAATPEPAKEQPVKEQEQEVKQEPKVELAKKEQPAEPPLKPA